MWQDLTEEELVEMPSCNLAETVHNKWLQQSGKRGNDLYVATVDDYVRAFTQVVAYYQFSKGDRAGTGPSKEDLRLRLAQRNAKSTGDPKKLHAALEEMPGASTFCTREPHLEGEEVFLSLKRRVDVPIGSEYDSHRPDKISMSRPVKKTRYGGTNFVNLTPEAESELAVEISPLKETTVAVPILHHTKVVLETTCNEKDWHIARLPKTSAKACFAQQAITKKKCVAKIVQYNKSTAAPTYMGMMTNYKKNKVEQMQFYFCNDDIERCVKGTRRKWVMAKPPVPKVWPVKLGTNLTQQEVFALEHAGFCLAERPVLAPHELFSVFKGHINFDDYPAPGSPDEYPKRRFGKNIRRNSKAPTTKHSNSYASALSVNGNVLKVTMLPSPALGSIITFESRQGSKASQYFITVGQFPSCDCPFFKDMATKSLGKRGQWVNCKHMYYVFTQLCDLLPEVDQFIHAPSFSYNEIKHVLEILLPKCQIVRTV